MVVGVLRTYGTLTDELAKFFKDKRGSHNYPPLLDRWTPTMETQINVAADGGREVQYGRKKSASPAYTDGTELWMNRRIKPEFKGYVSDSYTTHIEAIGITGWDFEHKVSKYVFFEIDSLQHHENGITPEQITALVEKLKKAVKLPLMIKGIQTAEDADLCVKHGVDIIYVSNHGGRQLDHCRGAIELLPEVISVARGKAQFVIDSGFVRGTDIMKAVARGAAMVGIGKLPPTRTTPPIDRITCAPDTTDRPVPLDAGRFIAGSAA